MWYPPPPFLYCILSLMSPPFLLQPMVASQHTRGEELPLVPNVILKVGLFSSQGNEHAESSLLFSA